MVDGDGTGTAGRLYLVGLGPGDPRQMTPAARQAIEASGVVTGYKTYVDLVEDLLSGKQVIATGMRQEVQRVRQAIDLAQRGQVVSLVCSGDPGIYGMAGLVYEVLREQERQSGESDAPEMLAIEVVPGVSALSAAASLLGAPLMHDFAVISLSDLLTPWEAIAARLEAAAAADFVLVLYNPSSGRRTEPLREARRILLAGRSPSTPVGIVTAAYRPGQQVVITDLESLPEHEVGMLSTVVVGNSATFRFSQPGGPEVMVTPRGYGAKYDLSG